MVRTFQMYFCVLFLCLYAGYTKAADYRNVDVHTAIERESSIQQTEIFHLLNKDSISLDDILQVAMLCNPEIAAAQNKIGAATGRLRQAGLYPNPTIEFEAKDIPAGDVDFSRNQNTVAIIQPIIIGKRRSAAISAAFAEQESRRFSLQNTIYEVLGDVRMAYVELTYYERAFILQGEMLTVANKILKIVRTRFDARAATEPELISAQLNSTKLELNRRKMKLKQVSAAQHLQSLLPDVEVPVEKISTELSLNLPGIDLEHLLTAVRGRHPLVLAAKKSTEAAEHRLALAKAERIPDVSLRTAYGRNTAEGENIIEFGISIPLPFFNRNQGRMTEMRHMATWAHNDARTSVARRESEIASAQTTYMASRDYAAVYQTKIVPAAERFFTQTMERFRAGRGELQDLIDAQEKLAGERLVLLEATRDLNIAYAHLHKIVGPSMNEILKKDTKGDL